MINLVMHDESIVCSVLPAATVLVAFSQCQKPIIKRHVLDQHAVISKTYCHLENPNLIFKGVNSIVVFFSSSDVCDWSCRYEYVFLFCNKLV
jgi:hypothetical protein